MNQIPLNWIFTRANCNYQTSYAEKWPHKRLFEIVKLIGSRQPLPTSQTQIKKGLFRPIGRRSTDISSYDRQGGGAQSSVKELGVANVWVTSTRTSKSSMRYRACQACAVYSVSLRLACRAPQWVGTGSCSPFERWVGQLICPQRARCAGPGDAGTHHQASWADGPAGAGTTDWCLSRKGSIV